MGRLSTRKVYIQEETSSPTPSLSRSHLDLSNTSSQHHVAVGFHGRRNRVTLEAAEHTRILSDKGSTAAKGVNKANMSQVGLANSIGGSIWRCEELAVVLQKWGLDVLENVAFGDDTRAGAADVEGVAGVLVPHVVDGVEEGGASNLGGAAGGVVDVVADHGDEIAGAGEVDTPVVVVVAGSGPGGGTVEFRVGDGDTAGGGGTCDELCDM